MKDERPTENVCLLTYSCDDSDGIEKSSCKSPHDRVLILLPIPALLLHGYDQLLLKSLEAGGHLSSPVLLMQNFHSPNDTILIT